MTRIHQIQALFTESGLATVLHDGTEDMPLEQLVVTLSELQQVNIHLIILPPIVSVPILQMAVELPVRVRPGQREEICQLLCAINSRIPINGFEISDMLNDRVLLRIMIPLLSEHFDSHRVLDMCRLMVGLLQRCSPFIHALAAGDQDYQTARSGVLEVLQH